jgi:hypothetical protein
MLEFLRLFIRLLASPFRTQAQMEAENNSAATSAECAPPASTEASVIRPH